MSKNGTKGNTPQWDRNDGDQSCSAPDNSPAVKVHPRPSTFCQDVTINGDLIVKGNVKIEGTLTVSGTITAPFFNGTAAKAVALGG